MEERKARKGLMPKGRPEVSAPPQRGLCPRRPEIEDFDGEGGALLPAAGLLEEGGGAGATGEGDDQDAGGEGEGLAAGLLGGAAQHLAIALGAGGGAVAIPLGGDGLHGPAEAMGGDLDGVISAAGIAMEEAMDEATGDGLGEGGGDTNGRPIEITATTGHEHQGAAEGLAEGKNNRQRRERPKQRRGNRRCGTRKRQIHGGIGEEGGG